MRFVCNLFFLIIVLTAPVFSQNASSTSPLEPSVETLKSPEDEKKGGFSGQFMTHIFHSKHGGIDHKTETPSMLKLEYSGKFGNDYRFYINNLTLQGGCPSDHTGDLQGISYIDSPDKNTFMEAWVEKDTDKNGGNIRFGLQDLNSEFDCTVVGWLFLNSSFGMGYEIAQTGNNGPSIFPVSSLGLRYKKERKNGFYFQTGIYDGCPGDPENHNGTHIILKKEDGILMTAETGIHRGGNDDEKTPLFKIALGGWKYTSKFDDLIELDSTGNAVKNKNNQGFYMICSKRLWQGKRNADRRISAFIRMGFANPHINQVESMLTAGAYCTNILKKKDRLGLGIARATNGSHWMKLEQLSGISHDDHETALEATWEIPVSENLILQPDCQWIANPGTDESLKDALSIGLNIAYTF
ncbi:MAG: carbohydrate porin [Candidatus Riflebacteria bacterium]|nr:carbohydrate porin [Candidatus Riflebacteria bacterium]